MQFHLDVHRKAQADIDRAVDSLRRECGRAYASRWRNGFMSRLAELEEMPAMWPIADEADELGIELRFILFGRKRRAYRILFTIDGDTVSIHRVRHASQDRLTTDDVQVAAHHFA